MAYDSKIYDEKRKAIDPFFHSIVDNDINKQNNPGSSQNLRPPTDPNSLEFLFHRLVAGLRTGHKSVLPMLICLIYAPNFIASLYLGYLSSGKTTQVNQLPELAHSFTPENSILTQGVLYFTQFLTSYFLIESFLWLLFIAAYASAIHMIWDIEKKQKEIAFYQCIKRGISTIIPRGFLLAIGIGVLLNVSQVLFMSTMFVATLLALCPIFVIVHKQKILQTLWNGLTLKFFSQLPSKYFWSYLIGYMSLLCLAQLAFVISEQIPMIIGNFDEYLPFIPRSLMLKTNFGTTLAFQFGCFLSNLVKAYTLYVMIWSTYLFANQLKDMKAPSE